MCKNSTNYTQNCSKQHNNEFCSINGATQIRAGVLRPEIFIGKDNNENDIELFDDFVNKQDCLDAYKIEEQPYEIATGPFKCNDCESEERVVLIYNEKYPKKIWGVDTKNMTPDWAPNRIKFRNKILPFYHEQYAAVGKYGTGCIYDKIASIVKKKGGKFKKY